MSNDLPALDAAVLGFLDGDTRLRAEMRRGLAERAPILAQEYVCAFDGTRGGALYDVVMAIAAVDHGAAAAFCDAFEREIAARILLRRPQRGPARRLSGAENRPGLGDP